MSQRPSRPPRERPPAPAGYFAATRGAWYGFLFALPVLLAYEGLLFVFQPNVINGADAILRMPLLLVRPDRRLAVEIGLVVTCGLLCWAYDGSRRRAQGQGLQGRYFIGMFAESFVYALFLGEVVTRLMRLLSGGWALQVGGHRAGPLDNLIQSLGAGIYEELLFRVLVMGGLSLVLISLLRIERVLAWVLAALASSFLFSAFHYVGSLGDSFALDSFVFRFLAGAVLASLFACRGFGIAVWTHALYDLLVMLQS